MGWVLPVYIEYAGDKSSHQFLLLRSYPMVLVAECRFYLSSVQPDMSVSVVLAHQIANKRTLHAGTLYSHVVVIVCMCRPMKPKVIADLPRAFCVKWQYIATGLTQSCCSFFYIFTLKKLVNYIGRFRQLLMQIMKYLSEGHE